MMFVKLKSSGTGSGGGAGVEILKVEETHPIVSVVLVVDEKLAGERRRTCTISFGSIFHELEVYVHPLIRYSHPQVILIGLAVLIPVIVTELDS